MSEMTREEHRQEAIRLSKKAVAEAEKAQSAWSLSRSQVWATVSQAHALLSLTAIEEAAEEKA